MRLVVLLVYLFFLFLGSNAQAQSTRDPLLWPFEQRSIWNMPIGDSAVYVHAQIEQAQARGMTIDEDVIVLTPDSPLVDIFTNYAGWSGADRCPAEGPLLFSAPMPENFTVSPDNWDGLRPNSGLAVLMADGQTIRQTQPFAKCDTGLLATSQFTPPAVDIFGDGIRGAHGGSGLSAIGGTLRIGELTSSSGPIRHVMKVNLYAAKNLYYDAQTEGYRWPAIRADGYADGNYGSLRTNPIVPACRMGALLALPTWLNLDSLGFETIPARTLAQAFQEYGAYIVDDTAWDVYAMETEWGPNGRFTEDFEANWGFPFIESDKNTPWARDMDRIFLNLHVVDNNSDSTIGGGGTPLADLAPPFQTTSVEEGWEDSQIVIYPNPATDQVWIEGEGMDRIALMSSDGRLVLEQAVNQAERWTFSVEDFASGIYFLSIQNEVRRVIRLLRVE